MSQNAIAQPVDCSQTCVPSGVFTQPGPKGDKGDAGTNGTDGINAFTLTADGTGIMPAEGGVVTLNTTTSTDFLAIGQVVFVTTWGYLQVTAVPTSTSVTLLNLKDTGTGAYAGNVAPGNALSAGQSISPAGVQGPTGAALDPTLFFQIANNLNEGVPATMRSNLGLGTVAVLDEGVANGQVPKSTGGIAANQCVFGTGTGIIGKDAPQAQVALDLVPGALDGQVVKVVDTIGLTLTEVVIASTAGGKFGVKTITDAALIARLGLTANPPMLLYQDVRATSVEGSAFTSGISFQPVPLNTEIIDTGSYGSISGNQITLAAGTYRFEYGVVGYDCGNFQGVLYSVTGATAIANAVSGAVTYGTVQNTAANASAISTGQGRFTLLVPTIIELRAACSSTGTFGHAAGFVKEVYSYLQLMRE